MNQILKQQSLSNELFIGDPQIVWDNSMNERWLIFER